MNGLRFVGQTITRITLQISMLSYIFLLVPEFICLDAMSLKLMFDTVADRYDLLNCVLAWGLDGVWRKTCAKECATGTVIVDLCCGTGDLALHISRYAAIDACIVGLDFSEAMLKKAMSKKSAERQKRDQINLEPNGVGGDTRNIDLILADASSLPFRDENVDRIGISFSFRNLVYKNPKAKSVLKEVLRALRTGGKFVCVETSQPRWHFLRFLYHSYLGTVVPFVGGHISGRKGAYRYLGMSATAFPPAKELADMLSSAGFRDVSFIQMTFGIVAMHVGVK